MNSVNHDQPQSLWSLKKCVYIYIWYQTDITLYTPSSDCLHCYCWPRDLILYISIYMLFLVKGHGPPNAFSGWICRSLQPTEHQQSACRPLHRQEGFCTRPHCFSGFHVTCWLSKSSPWTHKMASNPSRFYPWVYPWVHRQRRLTTSPDVYRHYQCSWGLFRWIHRNYPYYPYIYIYDIYKNW